MATLIGQPPKRDNRCVVIGAVGGVIGGGAVDVLFALSAQYWWQLSPAWSVGWAIIILIGATIAGIVVCGGENSNVRQCVAKVFAIFAVFGLSTQLFAVYLDPRISVTPTYTPSAAVTLTSTASPTFYATETSTSTPRPLPTDIPTATLTPTAQASPTAASACTLALAIVPTAVHVLGVIYYEVQPRDSISMIAGAFHITEDALVAANESTYPVLKSNRNCLRIGWVLVIPQN